MGMKFKVWFESSGLSQTEFAKKVKITQSAVSHLLKGRKSPSLDLILRIEKATGGRVKPNDWRDDAKPESMRIAAE